MADVRDAMDGDLEDGELSGSDSEMGAIADNQPAFSAATVFSDQSFQSRSTPQPSASIYRSTDKAVDSSDSDADSDEENALWRPKRQKVAKAPQPTARHIALPYPQTDLATTGRKVNNIWGSVVQEQCQDAITSELGIFGMEGEFNMASRNVETYNYIMARKIMEKERLELEQSQNQKETAMLDCQLDEYMKGRGSEENEGDHSKRKRPAKEQLGPRAEMDIKGRYEITEEDPDDRVVQEIAHRLQEPKFDLLERVVRVVGKKKAIELLGETATVEESGGVFTLDGSRRRTPGGVYLNLLKNTPSVSKAQLREIFFDENQAVDKSRKAAQKRRRHMVAKKMKQALNTLHLQEHDDGSRETFASDTNEALAALEEVAAEDEVAMGTEETAVVYNSADLEVF